MGRSLRAALAVGLFAVAGTAFAAPPMGRSAEAVHRRDFRRGGADPAKIDNHLIPIRRDNTGLRWENDGADARVKVVSWMSEDTFQRYYSQPAELPTDKSAPPSWSTVMWVTAVPQVQDFCRALGTRDNAAITNRLLQLIGLRRPARTPASSRCGSRPRT